MKNITAYDYKLQKWVQGRDAIELKRVQILESLSLLQGEQGEKYAGFVNVDRAQTIELLKQELIEVNASVQPVPDTLEQDFEYSREN